MEQICPRCKSSMQTPRVALSRLTRGEHDVPLYICHDCGVDEAIAQYQNNGVAVDWREEPF